MPQRKSPSSWGRSVKCAIWLSGRAIVCSRGTVRPVMAASGLEFSAFNVRQISPTLAPWRVANSDVRSSTIVISHRSQSRGSLRRAAPAWQLVAVLRAHSGLTDAAARLLRVLQGALLAPPHSALPDAAFAGAIKDVVINTSCAMMKRKCASLKELAMQKVGDVPKARDVRSDAPADRECEQSAGERQAGIDVAQQQRG